MTVNETAQQRAEFRSHRRLSENHIVEKDLISRWGSPEISSTGRKMEEKRCESQNQWEGCWWRGQESNQGHGDFQSPALPTELPRHTQLMQANQVAPFRLKVKGKYAGIVFPSPEKIVAKII